MVINRQFYRILSLMVMLVAAGQMTNTIYVPALSDMAQAMHVQPGMMQTVIACYLFPYGLLQFVYGPLSDYFGRKPMILIGTMIFTIGSLIGFLANHFAWLLVATFLQGSGTAVGGVMVRTVMKDRYSGASLQKANSYMMVALILAPLLAPLIGGLFATFHHWRGIFLFLTIYGIILWLVQYWFLFETNAYIGHRGGVWHRYRQIFSNKTFLINLMLLIVGNGGLAVFEVSSGALLTSVIGLSPVITSLLFIIPLPFYIAGSYLPGALADKIHSNILLTIGCLTLMLSGASMIIFYYAIGISILAILLPGALYFFGCGMIMPTASTKAIDIFPNIAGTAGSILGGAQNLGAGILTALASLATLHSQLPLAIILSSLAVLALLTLLFALND